MKEKRQNIRTALTIITFTVLLAYFVNHTYVIKNFFKGTISLIIPFLIGCAIAFILNIPMSGIEKKLFTNEKSKLYRFKRAISLVITYVITVAFIAAIILVIAPELGRTVSKLQEQFPTFVNNVKEWATKYTKKYPELDKEIRNFNPDIKKISGMLFDNGGTIISTTISLFSSIIGTLVNILVGFVFSVYILSQKERLGRQAKMIIYALFKESTADEMLVFGKIAHTTFAKFMTCQFREGFILGTMFAVTMTIIKLPYALTIGIVIGFTALIPIFGAFLGLFIGIFLILVDMPSKVVMFIITFFVLQNIENYLIYPKLVGGDIGLPPIWVLLAVLVGGDLMGVIGMFVFIPFISVIYAYVKSIINRRLTAKSIDVNDKQAPDEVVPLMESRRRSFSRKSRRAAEGLSNVPVVSTEETDEE